MDNNYKVNKYIICYFDVLGYKQTLQEIGDNNYIHYIVSVMDTIKTVLNFGGIVSFEYHIFSDNIIIFVPVREDKYENILAISELISGISILQRNLIGQYNVFIRGCILIGNLYYDGSFVFGSGLIKAHALEDKIAVYPRIILDAECANLCYNEGEIIWKTVEKAYIRKDEDGYFVLNYLCDLNRVGVNKEGRHRMNSCDNPIDTSEYIKLPDPFGFRAQGSISRLGGVVQ